MIAVYTEKYGLSLLFLYLTWFELQKPWLGWNGQPATGTAMFIETGRHANLLLLDLFTALLLLLGRPTAVPPQKLKGILIPLATTFFNFTYNAVSWLGSAAWFPTWLQRNLCPLGLRLPFAIVGFVLFVIGPLIALWGLLYLGRSFGVFVEVRKVVLGGPYRWVRHPMYLGWICMYAGLALGSFSAVYFLLVLIHFFLLRYRAHLEEEQLSEYSPEYREYLQHAGFIFPRFRPPAGTGS